MSALEPGMTIAPLVVESVSPHAMKTIAALMNDPNPIHWDEDVTEALGLGRRLVNQGPVTISYMLTLAVRAAGGTDRVRRFEARFLANVFAGDRLECRGTVVSVDAGTQTATLEIVATVNDAPAAAATAIVALAA